jgi:alkylated DNA repair dioxygenase AlkB
MNTSPYRNLLSLAGVLISLGFLAMPVFGQDAENMDEFQRQIEAQQKQLEAQQKQLDEQKQLMQELQKQIESQARDAEKETVTLPAEKSPAEPPVNTIQAQPEGKAGLSDAAKHDQDSPTSTNVTYFDPVKVINIPGSKTSIGLHGLAEFQIIHDTDGLNNNRFDTASIPIDGAPSQTKFSVNPSQLAISSTTLVSDGALNTMISMDFNGQIDRPEPRLRIAYGEFVSDALGLGVLGGQAYATMFDLSAVPETLDFAGPAGLWQQRQPLLRLTRAVAQAMVMEVAIETPENVNYINAKKLTHWPDLVLAGTWRSGGKHIKHFRLAGLARDLNAQAENGAKDSALGWAITGSGKLGLPYLGAKDNFKFTLHYGDGYGTQIKGGPQEGAIDPATSELKTIGIFGVYAGIQHFWSDHYRSNLVYGHVDSDNPAFLSGDTFDNTSYAAADFIWSPYKEVTLGVEYLWGRRENKDGASGRSNRLLLSSRINF